LKSIPRLDNTSGQRLEPIRGLPPDLIALPQVCAFYPRCDFYKTGVCDTQVPPLRQVAENHNAACLFDVTIESEATVAAAQ